MGGCGDEDKGVVVIGWVCGRVGNRVMVVLML